MYPHALFLSFLSPVFVSTYFFLMDLLLVMRLCGFQVFNQGVNCRLPRGNFLISVSRWSHWGRTESKSLWQSLRGEGKGDACLCGVTCVHLCSCACLFHHSLSVCGCVCFKCLTMFAAVFLYIYPHILCCLSHPLNDAKPHFSLSLIVLGCLVTAWGHCQPHQLSPICCITCSGPPYLPDCAQRLCSWMDQTCEVKSGPSSLKGFLPSLGYRPSKCVECWSHIQNRHAWRTVTKVYNIHCIFTMYITVQIQILLTKHMMANRAHVSYQSPVTSSMLLQCSIVLHSHLYFHKGSEYTSCNVLPVSLRDTKCAACQSNIIWYLR